MQHVFGILTIVQEGRFRLYDSDGRTLHFTLARAARTAGQDLTFLAACMAPIRVDYDQVAGSSTLVAHRITQVDKASP
ncbi:hypothetical protein [Yoonia sp.]|uniref:hypothetical protein n=1 Tax=Yoonia sp. TaxID=2212373 RepID=UPI00391C2885